MTDENTQIAHFGVLQSAFWKQHTRPPPPIIALDLQNPRDTFSSHQGEIQVSSQQLQPQHPEVQKVVRIPQSLSPYPCPSVGCSKSFIRKEHLNRHLTTHTSVRPFKCNICKSSFTRKLGYFSLHHVSYEQTLSSPFPTSLQT